MGQLNYNSLRIYKEDKSAFSLLEAESLKAFFFNSPYYHREKFRFVSRFTPPVFELTDKDLCLELQFNTYNDHIVMENIDRLYEITFPYYEFWFITANDHECVDRIGRFTAVKMGERDIPSTSRENWQICHYAYNRIELIGTEEIPEQLKGLNFHKETGKLVSMDTWGLYNSYSEKNYTDGQRYKLTVEEHSISLEEKYDPEKGGIKHITISGAWYSDMRIAQFIHEHLTASEVKEIHFYFNNRLTRLVSREKYNAVMAFDGWDNCANPSYREFLRVRQPQLSGLVEH